MKKLLILLNVLMGILIIGACDESQVGYLLTKDAAYEPDTIIIRQTLDPELDAVRELANARIRRNGPYLVQCGWSDVLRGRGGCPPVPRGSVCSGRWRVALPSKAQT